MRFLRKSPSQRRCAHSAAKHSGLTRWRHTAVTNCSLCFALCLWGFLPQITQDKCHPGLLQQRRPNTWMNEKDKVRSRCSAFKFKSSNIKFQTMIISPFVFSFSLQKCLDFCISNHCVSWWGVTYRLEADITLHSYGYKQLVHIRDPTKQDRELCVHHIKISRPHLCHALSHFSSLSMCDTGKTLCLSHTVSYKEIITFRVL